MPYRTPNSELFELFSSVPQRYNSSYTASKADSSASYEMDWGNEVDFEDQPEV